MGYSQQSVSNALSMIPEISTYPTQPRYEHYSPTGPHHSPLLSHPSSSSRHTLPTNTRSIMGGHHQSVHHWNSSPVEPYVSHTRIPDDVTCLNLSSITTRKGCTGIFLQARGIPDIIINNVPSIYLSFICPACSKSICSTQLFILSSLVLFE